MNTFDDVAREFKQVLRELTISPVFKIVDSNEPAPSIFTRLWQELLSIPVDASRGHNIVAPFVGDPWWCRATHVRDQHGIGGQVDTTPLTILRALEL
jgi:hypothetical protein